MIEIGNQAYFVNLSVLDPNLPYATNLPYAKLYLTSGDLQRSMKFVTKITHTFLKFTVSLGIKCIMKYDLVGNQSYFIYFNVMNLNLPYSKLYLTFGDLQRSLNLVVKTAN